MLSKCGPILKCCLKIPGVAKPMPITSLGEFRDALDSKEGIVITDAASGPRFHVDPAKCGHVQERWFESKVLANAEKNGGYFAVGTLEEARETWPDVLVCRSSACASA